MRTRSPGALIVFLAAVVIWGTVAQAEDDPRDTSRLGELFGSRDFFALRRQLESLDWSRSQPPEWRFWRAAAQLAFNDPEASSESATALLATADLPRTLETRIQHLQLNNYLRLHRYGEALAAARAVLADPSEDALAPLREDAASKLALLEALQAIPQQRVVIRAPSRLALGPTRRIPLDIDGVPQRFALDTGANLSAIMRSEAERIGLTIRPAGVVVSTSTTRKVLADVAVADRVVIGNAHFQNVVFLVLSDELLSFPDGPTIPGLLGFPVIEALGEVRFRRDNVMEIPKDPPLRSLGNLALDNLDPLIQVRYAREDIVCRLDTGAAHTVFYEPFFRRYRERVEAAGRSARAKATGVGGSVEVPAYRLPKIVLTVAAAGITLRRVDVYTQPIRPAEENYLFCNLGIDALQQHASYSISFRDMALELR